jgi:PAS domain S-box-containing protein
MEKKRGFETDSNIDIVSAIKTSIDGMAILNDKGEYLFLNDAHVNIYGYDSEKELIGKTWEILYGSEELDRFYNNIMPSLYKTGVWRGEATGKKKDGSYFPQELSLSITKDKGIICVVRDITERHRAVTALKESELKFRLLIDNLQEAVAFVDNNNVINYANKRFCELYGYTLEELIGKSDNELVYEKEESKVLFEKTNLRKKNISDIYELKFKKKNGEMFWGEVKGTPYYDINGNIIGSIGILTDITEIKKSREALEKSEEKYRSFLQNFQGIAFKGGTDFIPSFFHGSVEKITGYKEEDILKGNPPWDKVIHPDDKNKIIKKGKEFQNPGYATEQEYRIIRKDGKVRWIGEFIRSVGDETGKLWGFEGVMYDITEKKKAEEALRESEERNRTLIDTSPYAILLTDINGKILFLNKRGYELFKFNRRDEIIGKTIFDIVIKEDHQRLFERHKTVIEEGTKRNAEYKMITSDGTIIPVELSATVIKNADGIPIGFTGIVVDISKRKAAEERLRKYTEELKESNIAKDKFYSIISHDLRSPFHIILGFSELLPNIIDKLEKDKIKEIAESIYKTSVETYNLLDNLLQWTGAQTGRIKSLPENVSLYEVFYATIKIFGENAKRKNLLLISNLKDNIEVLADKNMINTVIRNLVNNAIKFTPKGGKITLDAEEKDDTIFITVSDTGVGMGKGDIARLFKLESAYTRKGTENEKGSGIGLILCKEFIEKNKGTISVESEKDKGSKFIISLPKAN